jgi:hypothetical protein
MTYYEELAVAQDASVEEIHQAYRALARLLHPDNHADAKLKSAAERQMMRLNEILATLADPEKRRRYNESIGSQIAVAVAAPPRRAARSPRMRRHLPWLLAVCILAGVGIWYLRSNDSGDLPPDRRPAAPPERAVQPAQAAVSEKALPPGGSGTQRRLRARPKAPLLLEIHPDESPAAADPLSRLPEPSEPAALPRMATKADLPAQTPQTAPPVPAAAQRAAEPASAPASAPGFTGHWFYAQGTREAQTPGMYPPEFIEFFLSEERGVLSGKYWARYRIPDKPVSPEVQFRVSGAAQNGDATALQWVSDDGANGQMKAVLRGANSMEVTWWTTTFGRQTALTSGTALLVRQQAR